MTSSVFHLIAESDEVKSLSAGVCADFVYEARSYLRDRMRADGHGHPVVLSCERLAGSHDWEHGTVLVYEQRDRPQRVVA